MTQRMWTVALFAATAGMLIGGHAGAQGFGGGGQTPTGSNLTSGLGFGNASFGSNSGMGSMGGGAGGFGSGGMGAGGFGSGGFGQGGGLGQGGLGAGGFGGGLGGQQQGGFIGRDSAEVASMFESMSRQGSQNANRTQRRNNNNNRGRDNNSGSTAQQRVRVQLKVGFDVPDAATSPMATALSERLARVLEERSVSDFDFTVNDGNVVLTGVADDSFERMLIEKLISQQPGVVNVANQMTVAEGIDAPTPQE
ncbi:BON domain-containing protein [Aeoliella sp. ICT_H6.2]|uniref:BON domain-containing protein n=1 Tax=Aeoliella straminimaris TaxID=2954799 RepID=A0A9X2FGB6_9BACT|nr:BON domain-containing protein [Aeoliella straminimaris]MCO6047587.1 BON domain-containing protein [Aeoliella straminimaris]